MNSINEYIKVYKKSIIENAELVELIEKEISEKEINKKEVNKKKTDEKKDKKF